MADVNGLWTLIEGYLGAERLELYDLELTGRGRGRLLRVVVDGPGGVDLDRITEASRGLSRLLDEAGAVDGPYSLEVTSPGLERKLRRPEHFSGAVDRDVIVKTVGGERLDGSLAAADDAGIEIVTATGSRRLGYDDITSARTVFALKKTPKPGKSRVSR